MDRDSPDLNQTRVFATGSFSPPQTLVQREHFLTLVEGSEPGLRLPLGAASLKLGRRAGCDFVVTDDAGVSGQHCEVLYVPSLGEVIVTDLRSTNGTFIEGTKVQGQGRLATGALLQIGRQVFRHEALLPGELEKTHEQQRDLDKARHYVESLLPAPIAEGPIRTDWAFHPCAQLGGDAFGYHRLGDSTFAGYLFDISGHGVGAAMHSVSIMNVLRQRALPNTDFLDPAAVLASLNDMFQMEDHDGMYFSAWYGVYDTTTRVLRYASAGHHASYLASPGGAAPHPLQTRNLVIGAMAGARFRSAEVSVPPSSRLYVFSDGVFEVTARDGSQGSLKDFLPLLSEAPQEGVTESERLYRAVRERARPGPLDDDFSLLVVTFLS